MNTRVDLHIGFPKCASSTLQAYFHANDKIHVKEGICYPRNYRDKGGYHSHRAIHKPQSPLEIKTMIDAIADEALETHCHQIILSSEEFINSQWDKKITGAVISALNDKFGTENVRILALVRNHFPYVESVFSQFLKGGMFRTPTDAFFKDESSDILTFAELFYKRHGFDYFSFSDFIERIQAWAPQNAIDLVSIERDDIEAGELIEYLKSRYSITSETQNLAKNERYSTRALLSLHYAHGIYGFERTRSRRGIISKLFSEKEKSFSRILNISGPLFDRVVKTALADKERLAAHGSYNMKSLFSIPQAYEDSRDRESDIWVRHKDKLLIDSIMTAPNITLADARNMRRKISP